MRRMLWLALIALSMGGTAVAAPSGPAFAATLEDDGACLFTVTATWKKTKVDHVYTFWYLNGVYLLTSEAPNAGPNGGTLRRSTAVMNAGAFAVTTDFNAWHAVVQYYNAGAFVADVTTSTLNVQCGIAP
jgi:hypothetical protein